MQTGLPPPPPGLINAAAWRGPRWILRLASPAWPSLRPTWPPCASPPPHLVAGSSSPALAPWTGSPRAAAQGQPTPPGLPTSPWGASLARARHPAPGSPLRPSASRRPPGPQICLRRRGPWPVGPGGGVPSFPGGDGSGGEARSPAAAVPAVPCRLGQGRGRLHEGRRRPCRRPHWSAASLGIKALTGISSP